MTDKLHVYNTCLALAVFPGQIVCCAGPCQVPTSHRRRVPWTAPAAAPAGGSAPAGRLLCLQNPHTPTAPRCNAITQMCTYKVVCSSNLTICLKPHFVLEK